MSFLGMRASDDWADGQRPKNWREAILYLWPNGKAPLTAILSKAATEATDDPEFYWWTKTFGVRGGAVTGVYTDSGLAVSYVDGGTAGSSLYVKMAEATIGDIREGHEVVLRDSSDLTVDVVAKVTERVANGASSYVKVTLLEADDNSTSGDLSDCDRILVSGNINAEGAAMPDAISRDPVKWYNFTQIFRTPLEITGTALETKLRTNPQAYEELKREILEDHSIEMEQAFLWGVPTERTGSNGKPERTTMGIIPAIRGGYTGHGGTGGTVSNYVTESDWSGKTWLQGGEDWLDTQLETVFRYGSREKLAICGSGALMAINKLVKNGGEYSFEPSSKPYGIDIVKWVTPLGSINFLTHPLFNVETTTRNIMVVMEPSNVKYRPLKNRDTKFIGEGLGKTNTGYTRRDGIKEEYLTEAGLEYHHPVGWAYLSGFGSANTA